MAWIEVHQALRDHRKMMALAEALDLSEPHAAGHVLFLWLWALDNAQEGILPGSDRIIERAAGWAGESGVLVSGLIAAGFVDVDAAGDRSLHDWDEYTGRLIEKRRENAERMRAARAAKSGRQDQDSGEDGHNARAVNVQRTSPARAGATVPNRTQPYPTQPSQGGESINLPARTRAREAPDAHGASPSHSPTPPADSTDSAGSASPADIVVSTTAQRRLEPTPHPPTPAPRGTATAPTAARPTPTRREMVDTLLAAFAQEVGHPPGTLPEQQKWRNWLEKLPPGTTTDDLRRRALVYRTHYGQTRDGSPIPLTPKALVEHWSELEASSNGHNPGAITGQLAAQRADATARRLAEEDALAAEKQRLARQLLV